MLEGGEIWKGLPKSCGWKSDRGRWKIRNMTPEPFQPEDRWQKISMPKSMDGLISNVAQTHGALEHALLVAEQELIRLN